MNYSPLPPISNDDTFINGNPSHNTRLSPPTKNASRREHLPGKYETRTATHYSHPHHALLHKTHKSVIRYQLFHRCNLMTDFRSCPFPDITDSGGNHLSKQRSLSPVATIKIAIAHCFAEMVYLHRFRTGKVGNSASHL